MSREYGLTGRYSLLQGSYYGANCAVIGYASVFLLDKGITPSGVGVLIAVSNVLAVICQPLVAGFADRSRTVSLKQIIGIIGIAGVCLSLLLGISENKLSVAVWMLLCLITSLLMPLVNAVSVYFTNQDRFINFGVARGLGSLTYAAASYGLGYLTGKMGALGIPLAALAAYALILTGISLFRIRPACESAAAEEPTAAGECVAAGEPTVTREPTANRDSTAAGKPTVTREPTAVRQPGFLFRYPRFFVKMAAVVALFAFHNITSTYLIRMMERFGGGSEDMGTALAIAAVCELPTMLLYSRISRRYRAEGLLAVSAVCFFIKSVLLLTASSISVIYLSQMFQAFSFALFIPASVQYTNEVMAGADKIRGQALVTCAITLGSVVGNLTGGLALDWAGIPAMLLLSCGFALAGAVIMLCTTLKK